MNARRALCCASFALLVCVPCAWAQDKPAAASPAPAKPADVLGRENPRGAVIGFIRAARESNYQLAAQYINPPSKRDRPDELARELYIVLNGRLNARIYAVSDRPEGSLANPLAPDQEVIGSITTADGPQDVSLERVNGPNGTRVWLFSRKTLQWVPDVYEDVNVISIEEYLPPWLTGNVLGIRLFDWILLILLIPLLYKALHVVDWLIAFVILHSPLRRWAPVNLDASSIPGSVRLLVLALLIQFAARSIDLPLAERRLWAFVASVLTVVGIIGLLLRTIEFGERVLASRLSGDALVDSQGMMRLMRRVIQGLVLVGGVVMALQYFGFDPTTALAGLGIGGIAIALAAQKTLENVIGGFSIVFDKAIRVGDVLRVGETVGTVDYVGLRSTRIRTLGRTIVTVPNGTMATVNIETLSLRDRFWFHHTVGLTYGTTTRQVREIETAFQRLLLEHPSIDAPSARVRFIRLAAYSLDIELFAYLYAVDYDAFLTLQGELLIKVMEIVESAGAEFAFPSQTIHVANTHVPS